MDNGNAVAWFVDRHLPAGNSARLAFRDNWRSLTYAELAADTARFAGALQQAGIRREPRVVLLLQDTVDFPVAFWGTMRAGAVPVPINTLLTADTVSYILQDCRCAAVILSASLAATITAAIQAAGIPLVIVSQPDGPPPPGWTSFNEFTATGDPSMLV